MQTLYVRYGKRGYRTATPTDILDASAQLVVASRLGTRIVNAPRDAEEICRALCGAYEHERFGILFLDTRNQVLHAEAMFRGTIDGATVYPREVVKRALELNASAVIVTHQHPSGVAEPSEADRSITLKLSKALALVEIRLVDHVVLGADRAVSLAERGWL
ncbi:MAG: DNA repair protein RadC [Gammaproteobacteria bacterium]